MDKEEIIKGNKLIAFFMNGTVDPDSSVWIINVKGLPFSSGMSFHQEQGEYHSSWDWLMPVVEKIEKENYGFKMCRKVVEIYFDDTKAVIIKEKKSCRLESLYHAVIAFINWYNTTNSTTN